MCSSIRAIRERHADHWLDGIEDVDRHQICADIATLLAHLERCEDALHRIQDWARAYPLDIFPEPDMKRAHAVLKEHGITLDAISASNMRHVLTGVEGIVREALGQINE